MPGLPTSAARETRERSAAPASPEGPGSSRGRDRARQRVRPRPSSVACNPGTAATRSPAWAEPASASHLESEASNRGTSESLFLLIGRSAERTLTSGCLHDAAVARAGRTRTYHLVARISMFHRRLIVSDGAVHGWT